MSRYCLCRERSSLHTLSGEPKGTKVTVEQVLESPEVALFLHNWNKIGYGYIFNSLTNLNPFEIGKKKEIENYKCSNSRLSKSRLFFFLLVTMIIN